MQKRKFTINSTVRDNTNKKIYFWPIDVKEQSECAARHKAHEQAKKQGVTIIKINSVVN